MLLSVVIPFYHVEKYIGQCLALAGSLTDCEILLVDDCGQDASAQIAADFCRAHEHARVIRARRTAGSPLRAIRAQRRRRANTSTFWIATICPNRMR